MKKGYAYLLDALFAIVIFGVMLNAAVSLNEIKEAKNIEAYTLTKIGNDALYAMDEKRVLETFNRSLLEDSLRKIMPSNVVWKLDITRHEFNGKIFQQTGTLTIDSMYDANAIKIKRVFFKTENNTINTIKYYFVGELSLGTKK